MQTAPSKQRAQGAMHRPAVLVASGLWPTAAAVWSALSALPHFALRDFGG